MRGEIYIHVILFYYFYLLYFIFVLFIDIDSIYVFVKKNIVSQRMLVTIFKGKWLTGYFRYDFHLIRITKNQHPKYVSIPKIYTFGKYRHNIYKK